MSQDFDTGSGWEEPMSPEEKEMEKIFNLDEDEQKTVKEIQKQMNEVVSKFTFWMREQKATPKEYKIKFGVTLRGETLERWMWLQHFIVMGGWQTASDMIGAIMEAGVNAVWANEQHGHAAAVLAARTMEHMPPEISRAKLVESFRNAVKHRREVEERTFKESLEGGA